MTARARLFAALCAVVVSATALVLAQDLTHREADSAEKKLSAIVARGDAKPAVAQTANGAAASFRRDYMQITPSAEASWIRALFGPRGAGWPCRATPCPGEFTAVFRG